MSPVKDQRRRLYLLIEEADREFDSRSLIAVEAARRGMDVLIAPQWTIWQHAKTLPPGVMLFKGNNRVQATNMARVRHAGHTTASIEEEVLGLADETEIRHHYADGVQGQCDLFLVQGKFQAECLHRHFCGVTARYQIVGNPRVDLMRKPFRDTLCTQAASLRERHGEFVLLNTNFGGINPSHGDCLTFYNRSCQVGMVDPGQPQDQARFVDRMRWEQENARMLIAFAKALRTAKPQTKIILRPHPAESLERWHRFLGPNPPVEVIRDGGHLPWTLASSVMVHTGCTTGLEAALLDKPVLSLIPDDNPWHGSAVSNFANPTARVLDDALARIVGHLEGHSASLLDEMKRLDYSAYLEHDDTASSATRVVDALQGLAKGRLDDADRSIEGTWRGGRTGLLDWQREKYTVSLDRARNAVAKMSAYLGDETMPEVTEPAEGVIRIRRASV